MFVGTNNTVHCRLQLYSGSIVIERAENRNVVISNYFDFAVIFQKIGQYKFYNTLIAGRTRLCRADKNILQAGPARKCRPGNTSSKYVNAKVYTRTLVQSYHTKLIVCTYENTVNT